MKIGIKLSLREVRRAIGRSSSNTNEQRIICGKFPALISVESGLTVIKGEDIDLQLPGNYNITIEVLDAAQE